MNVFQQALQQYAKGSNTRLIGTFIALGALDGLVTFVYVYFIARHHQENFLLSYLLPLVLLLLGIIFLLIGVRSKGDWTGLIYVVLALFALFAAAMSFVVTWLLLTLVY